MKTKLEAGGQIRIPDEIRRSDHLTAGDSFELERLTPGHYLLTKQSRPVGGMIFTVGTADDGLPVIRVENGLITSRLVRDLESHLEGLFEEGGL